jgi:hypothetical protein
MFEVLIGGLLLGLLALTDRGLVRWFREKLEATATAFESR